MSTTKALFPLKMEYIHVQWLWIVGVRV